MRPPSPARMAVRSPVINVMVRAAEKAARGLMRDFGEVEQLQVSRKGPADFVSAADLKADRIHPRGAGPRAPRLRLPDRGAGGDQGRRRPAPLDRRSARRHHQLPARHPALGDLDRPRARGRDRRRRDLRRRQERAVLGREGRGRLAQRPAAARLRPPPARGGADRHRHAVQGPRQGTGPARPGRRRDLRRPPACAASARRRSTSPGSRRAGSTAIWERNLGPWDVAAGIVLVREAGGYVTEIEGPGRPESGASILAANDVLHRPLMRLLAGREARRAGEGAAPSRRAGCSRSARWAIVPSQMREFPSGTVRRPASRPS